VRLRAAGVAVAGALLGATLLGGCTSSSGGGSAAELCRAVGTGAFAEVFRQGFDPTDTPRALAQLKAAAVDLDELHDAAPSEVRGAVADERAYVDAVREVLQQVDPDDEARVVVRINALRKEREAARAASEKLTAYQEAHCAATTTTAGS
jgi:hypothetical protein